MDSIEPRVNTKESMPADTVQHGHPGFKRVLHIQVANNPTQEVLQSVAETFAKAIRNGEDTVTTTNDSIQCFNILIADTDPVSYINVQGAITIETIASVAHEVNQAYVDSQGEDTVSWVQTTDAQRQSMVNGVLFKLRYPDTTPEQQHENWLRVRQAEGWTYGKVKNEELKTNPAMVPYDALPQAQRVKDFLFQGVVSALKDKLPQPSSITAPVEIWNVDDEQFYPSEFLKLYPACVFRFQGQEQVHRSTCAPYINYDFQGKPAVWSIDTMPVNMTTEPFEPKQPEINMLVDQASEVNEVDKQDELQEAVLDVEHSLDEVTVKDEVDAANLKPWVEEDGEVRQPIEERLTADPIDTHSTDEDFDG
jgi:hypothetical protein